MHFQGLFLPCTHLLDVGWRKCWEKYLVQRHTHWWDSVMCDSIRDSDSSPFYSDSDSSPVFSLWLGLGLRPRDSDSSPVFFLTLTQTRTQASWLDRDSGPNHARVQAVAAVPCCAVYSDIRYILLFVFMFWKINKCWICGLLDSWLGLEIIFWLGLGLRLWGDDSDSDFEVMTRTRTWTRIWQPGLGHSTGGIQTTDPIIKCWERKLIHHSAPTEILYLTCRMEYEWIIALWIKGKVQ